ncbi:MAG: hypothetical protein OFPII_26130 [Osedax symbiont Rs1]|nr:MAG: hypothetical protein OFPII_26130 [Osedax symbiont Rs1]
MRLSISNSRFLTLYQGVKINEYKCVIGVIGVIGVVGVVGVIGLFFLISWQPE